MSGETTEQVHQRASRAVDDMCHALTFYAWLNLASLVVGLVVGYFAGAAVR